MVDNRLKQTPSQTIGPFFGFGLTPKEYSYGFSELVSGKMRSADLAGEPVIIRGRVIDGENTAINDAMVEFWQADPNGYHNTKIREGLFGYGRSGTGISEKQEFYFETYKPGSIGTGYAPHVDIIVFGRGISNHLFTRMYFPDEIDNENDLLLNQLEEQQASRLIARLVRPGFYYFDIFLQGIKETPFFDI